MRLGDIESKLSPAIGAYIEDVYHYLRGKPYPEVLCLDDAQFKAALKVRDRKTEARGAYNIPANKLYFRNRPPEGAVSHELEHWAQAQRVGPDVYIEQLQLVINFLNYEIAADVAATENAHKLTGKY